MGSIETEQQELVQEKFLQVKQELALLKEALKKKEAAKKAQVETPHFEEKALFIERVDKKKKDTSLEAQDTFDTTPGDHIVIEL